MKKIITTLFIASIALTGFGQSIQLLSADDSSIVSNTIVDVNLAPSSSSGLEFLVTNTGATNDTIYVRRTIFAIDAADATQFCWGGLCYGFAANISSLYKAIVPLDTIDFANDGFHAVFNSGTSTMTRLVHYRFYDKNNITDSTGITIRYNYSTGVNELAQTGAISAAYPNPASSSVSMKYDITDPNQKGQITVYDMLGKTVKEIVLNDKQGTAVINTSDLNAGIYFYKFAVGNKTIATKKLVISSK